AIVFRCMLSVAKLAPGQEAYYERSVARGLDDYYAGAGESPGVWAGRGAAALGLVGVVADGDLSRLISGIDPTSGRRLRAHAQPRLITVERIDPTTGERGFEQRELRPVAGFDLVFSVPKSVSVLHALGDHGTRRLVSEAHDSAWRAALDYLESEACVTRRGAAGVTREHADGFVAASFQHRTSRALDPHLHTHVVVGNLAQSPDGAWRALEGDAILRGYRLAAGHLYQAQLRAGLSRSLGVEWAEPVKGMAELAGVPNGVVAAFSTRRREILLRLEETGGTSWRAAQIAAIETRDRKQPANLGELRDAWRSRATELGLGRNTLARLMNRAPFRAPSNSEERGAAMLLLSPAGLTEKDAVFNDAQVVQQLVAALPRGVDASRVRELAARVVSQPTVKSVEAGDTPGEPRRRTTREMLALESRGLQIATSGREASAPAVRPEVPARLSAEQRRMVESSCSSRDRVVCVVGLAGAGKTTATSALARAFEQAEVPVIGAAPSGIAAERLAEEAGIRATTIHALLAELRREPLRGGSVIVVDEASMADTRTLVALLEQVERANGKAILIGDPLQLPSVAAGGLFGAIARELGATELRENRRQADPQERDLLASLRAGEPCDYLAHAASAGRLTITGDRSDAKATLLADWWEHGSSEPKENVMLALRRDDVLDLNLAAHLLMTDAGKLGTQRLAIGIIELAPGDRVVCRENCNTAGVRNGTRARVLAVDSERRSVSLLTDTGHTVEIPPDYLARGRVELGYAITGHASQGVTIDRAFVLAPTSGTQREWGYVALSRARLETRIYAAENDLDPGEHLPSLASDDTLNRVAHALEQTAAEALALDLARQSGIELEL
ncbi:MAG: relaxase domain-containing protein, partial [Actinomycetota bacterium]|nr:relaxase domain-containing protein [Actinomycetota bacterium]